MDLQHEIEIDASASDVFNALTTEEGIKGWWTSEAEVGPEEMYVGFGGSTYWMKFIQLESQEDDAVKWECIDTDTKSNEWVGTTLQFALESNEKTTLHFTHADWKDDAKVAARCNTVWGQLMHSLKDYVETGKGEPIS